MTQETDKRFTGRLAAGAAVVCWSIGNVVVARLELPGIEIAFWRQIVGALVYGSIFFLSGRRITWKLVKLIFPVAVLFSSEVAVFFTALEATTVANATIIGALQPILLLFVARGKFGEVVSKRLIGISLFAVAGVALVVLGSSDETTWSPRGDLLALLAMVLFSAYFVVVKSTRSKIDTFTLQTVAMCIGSILLLPFVLIIRGTASFPSLSWKELLWILFLLAVPGSGHFLMNWAHLHISLSLAGLLMLAVPVLSAVGAYLFLEQGISMLQIVGATVVLGALAIVVKEDIESKTGP